MDLRYIRPFQFQCISLWTETSESLETYTETKPSYWLFRFMSCLLGASAVLVRPPGPLNGQNSSEGSRQGSLVRVATKISSSCASYSSLALRCSGILSKILRSVEPQRWKKSARIFQVTHDMPSQADFDGASMSANFHQASPLLDGVTA